MLFNSLDFIVFLTIILSIYWLAQKIFKSNFLEIQNILLLISSFIFYSYWNYKFLFLLAFIILFGFFIGDLLNKKNGNKLIVLRIGVIVHILILFVFKYYNFFVEEFIEVFEIQRDSFFKIVLPIGISFYIFHGISYIVDIYNNKILPTKSIVQYGVFISYFPLLVSGPIERATNLLPQLNQIRKLNKEKIKLALTLIIWGYLKKTVIADNLSIFSDYTFNIENEITGIYTIVGILFFSIQIYCDFSGYTDIAIGVSKLFGIQLVQNFNYPYFSKNIKEFWSKWHISLTSFFRDYLYIPLGGSRVSNTKKIRNIFLVFIISGFWHGANWTFIIWGLIHFIFYIPFMIDDLKKHVKQIEIKIGIFNYIITFSIVTFAWIFFRANSFNESIIVLKNIFLRSNNLSYDFLLYDFIILMIFITFEIISFKKANNMYKFIPIMLIIIAFLRSVESQAFIYFQF